MILIYAPYPGLYAIDGWTLRIRFIDEIFKDKEKIYFYPTSVLGNTSDPIPKIEKIGKNVSFFRIDFESFAHRTLFSDLLLKSDFLYAHTVHSAPFLNPYYVTGKIITDLHGIAPEEEIMFGRPNMANFYNYYERELIEKSYKLISVTQNMTDHYVKKYRVNPEKFILLPIANDHSANRHKKSPEAFKKVIYAGGTQRWQNIDMMFDAASRRNDYQFTFLSGDLKTLQEKSKSHAIDHAKLGRVPAVKLPSYYNDAGLGFVLRDDIDVNNVACPTKLIEYIAFGVIPIILPGDVGDFQNLGGKGILLGDFIVGDIPNYESLLEMQEKNYQVFDVINQQIKIGVEELKKIKRLEETISHFEWKALPHKSDSFSTRFPTRTGFLLRRKGSYEDTFVEQNDICGLEYIASMAVPKDIAEFDLFFFIQPCPAIITKIVASVSYGDVNKEISFGTALAQHGEFRLAEKNANQLHVDGKVLAGMDAVSFHVFLLAVGPDCSNILMNTNLAMTSPVMPAQTLYKKRRMQRIREGATSFLPIGSRRWQWAKSSYLCLRKAQYYLTRWYQQSFLREKHENSSLDNHCDVLMQVDNFLAGGLENVVIDLCKTFKSNGITTGILVLGSAGQACEDARQNGIRVYKVPYDRNTYGDALKDINPKMIFSHYSINGLDIAHAEKIPVVQVIHNIYIWFNDEEKKAFLNSSQYTQVFVAVSDFAKKYSVQRLGLPEKKCEVICNGIDTKRFTSINERQRQDAIELRKSLGFLDSDFVFLSVGSLTLQKNHLGSIMAFEKLLNKIPSAKLVIIGHAYDRSILFKLEKYISDNDLGNSIIYAHTAASPEIYYQMADAFMLGSFYEGGPLALQEAIVSGLPSIITEVGFAERYRDFDGVILIEPPIDIIAYQGAIDALEPNANWCNRFAEALEQIYMHPVKPKISQYELSKVDAACCYLEYVKLYHQLKSINLK